MKTLRIKQTLNLFGYVARALDVIAEDNGRIRNQQIKLGKVYREHGHEYQITVTLRFDDELKNGHETFAITADIREDGREYAGGCLHEDIAIHFPKLAHLIPWHLCSTDGPLHYLANTCYIAGDKDHNGLRKGESRQIKNGRTGKLCWTLEARNAQGVAISKTTTGDGYRERATLPLFILDHDAQGDKPDTVPVLEWVPLLTHGEGKARDLAGARRVAIWPDASDEDLCSPELAERLKARLPALLARFKADMFGAGFLWPERSE